MKTLGFLLIALFSSLSLGAQCNPLQTTTYLMAYAVRQSNLLMTYSQSSTVGADAAYFTTVLSQADTLNGGQIGSVLTSTAGPGQTAQTTRTVDINATGFGTYLNTASVSGFDACTGTSEPPFNNAPVGTSSATYFISQPTINTPSPMYVADFSNCGPGVSCFPYNNKTAMVANTGQASGLPVWTLTGNAQMVTASCTSCQVVQLTATDAATGSCSPNVQAYYTVDGLRSGTANILILGPQVADNGSPVHSAVSGGYLSQWPFQIQNSCGSPMGNVAMNETFPNGFSFKVQPTDWTNPSPNSWTADGSGLFIDSIGEANATQPVSLPPQSPLGSFVVFDGNQYLNAVGASKTVPALLQLQAHYQDHGGYE